MLSGVQRIAPFAALLDALQESRSHGFAQFVILSPRFLRVHTRLERAAV